MKTSTHRLNLNGKIATATVDLFPKYSRIKIGSLTHFDFNIDQPSLRKWIYNLEMSAPHNRPLIISSDRGITIHCSTLPVTMIDTEVCAEIERLLS